MRHFLTSLFLFAALFQRALAGDLIPIVDSNALTKNAVTKLANGDILIEFIRAEESFENWTTLAAYRYQRLPGLSNDPNRYALAMQQVIKQANPAAPVKVSNDDHPDEAMLDFLTWPVDQSYVELDVFRFVRSRDGAGVVSLQLASKFVPQKVTVSQEGFNAYQRQLTAVRERRKSWIKQVESTDLRLVEAHLLEQH